jgi:hypothetical protein
MPVMPAESSPDAAPELCGHHLATSLPADSGRQGRLHDEPVSSDPADVMLVAGYAQLPRNTGAGVLWQHLTVIVRMDVRTGRVVDASTTLATRVADTFVRELLLGAVLLRDQERIVSAVETRYFGNGRKAIVGAIRDLVQRLRECSETAP